MKIKDRLLLLKRSLLVVFTEPLDVVIIKRFKGSKQKINCIFSDLETGTDCYKQDMVECFINKAETSEELVNICSNWLSEVRKVWNNENPNDCVNFFKEN